MNSQKDNMDDFLNGLKSLDDTIHDDSQELADSEFLISYKKLIDSSKDQGIPEFDPFRKISQRKATRKLKMKRIFYSSAASILLALLIGFLFIEKQNRNSEMAALTEAQLVELNENTVYALGTMSQQLNSSLQHLDQMQDLEKPFKSLQ
ncbi:hypothetical protein ACUNWD_09535 [Sunxiuqinia sp. A32]|uniref:hypothetical protein n=1 Tax=Sunxiuqinia sp. A32 TaxID=3461496 RepID=UPI00404640EC